MSFGVHGTALSWLESFLRGRTQSVSVSGKSSDRMSLTCGVPQGSILGPILFLIYCADVIAIAKRHGLGVHSHADDTQLYFHTAPVMINNKVQRLVVCMEEIRQWMNANRLRLNEDKTSLSGVEHRTSCPRFNTRRSHSGALTSRFRQRLCVWVSYWTAS